MPVGTELGLSNVYYPQSLFFLMPNRHGPGTHLGYMMPPPGHNLTPHEERVLRITYGECRANEYTGESHESKERCARIAWGAVHKSQNR